ncbi:MAG TPA: class I SAM-dependent methyltransferase [Calidithermus sp.]|nr:class I SAM-dependent methyltransferase [Calidithermus sp.]
MRPLMPPSGTRRLDAGCGAGLLALLASFRGAQVTALDASPGLLAIARQRLPAADVREGDREALPFPDPTFDAVTAVNSVFYAEDMAAWVAGERPQRREDAGCRTGQWPGPESREALDVPSDRIRLEGPRQGPVAGGARAPVATGALGTQIIV